MCNFPFPQALPLGRLGFSTGLQWCSRFFYPLRVGLNVLLGPSPLSVPALASEFRVLFKNCLSNSHNFRYIVLNSVLFFDRPVHSRQTQCLRRPNRTTVRPLGVSGLRKAETHVEVGVGFPRKVWNFARNFPKEQAAPYIGRSSCPERASESASFVLRPIALCYTSSDPLLFCLIRLDWRV